MANRLTLGQTSSIHDDVQDLHQLNHFVMRGAWAASRGITGMNTPE